MSADPMMALLRANMRAGELRDEAMGFDHHHDPILRGAPTHSCAHLLSALDDLGWALVPKQQLPPSPRTTTRTTRPGGRQVPLGPAVRALAAYLTEQGFMDEQRAERTARRVMTRALPLKQRRPRTQSQIREAA